jgi:nucleoside-diphosphate-sugar epimerase
MANNSELHVIFGTGPLGKWTARELVKMGHQVRLINRSGTAKDLPEGAEVVKGDAYNLALNKELTKGAAVVYQCAQPEYYEWTSKFMPMQAAILDAVAANGAKFIAAENIYMYGDTRGRPMTEDTPYDAHTKKGKVRQAMTEAVFATHQAGKVRAASVRGSDFFGPDDMIYTENVFIPALQGKRVNSLGRLDQPHTWTYAPDFGKALAIVGTREEALGRAWHVPSDVPVTQQQFMDMISAEIGKPVKVLAGSNFMLSVLGLFNKTMAEMPEMMYEFTQPFIMDSSKCQRAFGVQPTPFAQQITDTLAFARHHAEAHDAQAKTAAV